MNYAPISPERVIPEDRLEPDAQIAYLGLGGNVGNPRASIDAALAHLDADSQISVLRVSSLYRTAPIGLTEQPDFLNAVAQIETRLAPEDLLTATLNIENLLGRVRTEKWAPRVIDIDVLLYSNRVLSTPRITTPHPRMHERAFVLVPLAELAPDLRMPGASESMTMAELAEILAAQTRIEKIDGPPSFLGNKEHNRAV